MNLLTTEPFEEVFTGKRRRKRPNVKPITTHSSRQHACTKQRLTHHATCLCSLVLHQICLH